eukprot:TRINITY_DN11568_c0_g3_i1.p1 TRINITY_DN11568_c0_g3~~TRINITY_DN11568_c0_g3_i1.p1  ORF type:complete len:526 (+),score=61.23 TRINITY_DN11568_c0_g3_i1:101-1678(+)
MTMQGLTSAGHYDKKEDESDTQSQISQKGDLVDSHSLPRYMGADALGRSGTYSTEVSDDSERSITSITEALKQAREEKRRLFVRVKLPAFFIGGILLAASWYWVYASWSPRHSAFRLARFVLRSLGSVVWLFACFPTDHFLPKLGCWLIAMVALKCSFFHAKHTVEYMRHMEQQVAADLPCLLDGQETDCNLGAFYMLAQAVLYCSVHLWQVLYLLCALRLPPRATNAHLWFGLAINHFIKGASDFLIILPAIAIRSYQSGNIPYLVLVCSLLHGVYATAVGTLLTSLRFRTWINFTLLSKSGALTAAASIAGFIGNKKPQQIMELARCNCRCVSLDKVTEEDMKKSTPDVKLQAFSRTCLLHEIDVFLSHSWHDLADLKWKALQTWRGNFKKQHGREPRVWIDKYCIDQNNIEASLLCLPVFLAGCQSLLILAGSTYLSRLWCLEEVFVYLQMGRTLQSIEMISLEHEVYNQTVEFDVRDAKCSRDFDKEMLLATIEAGCDGFEGFNRQLRQALETVRCQALIV